MSNRTLTLVLLISGALITGCSSTTMVSIRRAPEFRSATIRHVLVIGMFDNQDLRKTFEDEFVRQWHQRGVEAVSSLNVLPPSTPLDKGGVAPFAKAHGFDTVLVARLKEKKTIQPGEPAVSTIETPSQEDTVEQILLAPPVSTSPFDLATVETNLYDVASEQRIWSGWSETQVMKKIPTLIPPFVKLVLKKIYN